MVPEDWNKGIVFRGKPCGKKKENTGCTSMLEYYQDHQHAGLTPPEEPGFDPIRCKYDVAAIAQGVYRELEKDEDAFVCLGDEKNTEIKRIWGAHLSGEDKKQALCELIHQLFSQYEASTGEPNLKQRDFGHTMGNLHMIYNQDLGEILDAVRLMDMVSRHVINQYIGIDGLDNLFSEQYIDFEWEMHLGMDHGKHSMDYYRDHFIHQIRDAYMLDRLLSQGGFYGPVHDVLHRPSASKVSRYFCRMMELQKSYLSYYPYRKLLIFDEDFAPRNTIYMAAYMAALFHDIGYPETHLQSLRRRIFSYMPNMHSRDPQRDVVSSGVFSLLEKSLLFTLVPFEELQNRLYCEKIDHGTISAIAFLLHFYEGGTINQLEPFKAAAVELAALAIYKHTYTYSSAEHGQDKEKALAYRPVFTEDPLSFLLRLCDDLQEWDRVYLEVSSESNVIICSQCHTPIVKKERDKEKRPREMQYLCNCYTKDEVNKGAGVFTRAFDGSASFPYRRIYNVQVCDYVLVHTTEREKNTCFYLEYDPYKLLHMAYINTGYARYRAEELHKLKLLLGRQAEIPQIWLQYFVTANPILIKVRLLDEFYTACIMSEKSEYECQLVEISLGKVADLAEYESLVEKLVLEAQAHSIILDEMAEDENLSQAKTSIVDAIQLYTMLYVFGRLCSIVRKNQEDPVKVLRPVMDMIADKYHGSDTFDCLLGDSLLQLNRAYAFEELCMAKYIPEGYLEQFIPGNWRSMLPCPEGVNLELMESLYSKDFTYTATERYVDPQNYRPVSWGKNNDYPVDAFTDLGFFEELHRNLEEKFDGKEEHRDRYALNGRPDR